MDEELFTVARFRAADAGDRGIDEPRVQIGVVQDSPAGVVERGLELRPGFPRGRAA
jgi:hypothetical protein